MSESFDLVRLVSEPKHDYFDKQKIESRLVSWHFENLTKFERQYLGEYEHFPHVPSRFIGKQEINDYGPIDWVASGNPDVILLFGTAILNQKWIRKFENRIINLHLGMSPKYRGSATLFWPFVHDDLDSVAGTIHLATSKVDGGPILKWVHPKREKKDHYYDLTNKTIKSSINKIPEVIFDFFDKKITPEIQDDKKQVYSFRRKDFNEKDLKKVLTKYYFVPDVYL